MTTNIQRFDDYTIVLFFSFPNINLKWGDDVPFREDLRLKKHLQRNLQLPPFRGTNGAQTRNLWDLRLHYCKH